MQPFMQIQRVRTLLWARSRVADEVVGEIWLVYLTEGCWVVHNKSISQHLYAKLLNANSLYICIGAIQISTFIRNSK
jgi:hypothetical protein